MIFTRQLATLIDSGLPLLRGLTVLGKQEPNPVLQRTINALADSVQTGSTFSESLAQHPKIFNKLYVNMVKAGELGGVLELVLNRLAEFQEKAQKLKNKIVAAMVYPVIVMFIAIGIVFFLLIFIVPKFEKIFEDMLGPASQLAADHAGRHRRQRRGSSPISTGLSIIVGDRRCPSFALQGHGCHRSRPPGDRHASSCSMPLFGDIQRKSAISRFTRTLGTLVTSGVPILQALNITRDTAGNVIVADAITKVHDAVQGRRIASSRRSKPARSSRRWSSRMVDVGEETGQLPEMLLKIADVYDDEVDNAVTALTSLLEPIMIVFLALIVGMIVLALFLPLIEIIQGLQSR